MSIFVKTLTSRTIHALKQRLADGQMKPGEKLPTLQELTEELGVSRTVIREAIAGLRSDGLVESRHGVGTFVCSPDLHPVNGPTDEETAFAALTALPLPFMDLLELRMAFEVHAAGLAAARRSWAQEANIWSAARRFETALDADSDLDDLDLAFHASIAEATNNRAFVEFFAVMGRKIIPQPAFSKSADPNLITPEYIEHTMKEHAQICEAISAGDTDAARTAMQAHLSRSHKRYRGI